MIELLQQWEVVSYTAVEEARTEKLFKLRVWSTLFDYDSDDNYDAGIRSDN